MANTYSKKELENLRETAVDLMSLAIVCDDLGGERYWKEQAEKAESDLQKLEDETETNNKQTEDCGGNR